MSILLNNPSIKLGETLSNFRDFTQHFPSDLKGEAISNSDVIRDVHNSFARADPFQSDETKVATEDDDVFHFVAYVPVDGKLYELDGLQPAPICHGDCPMDQWIDSGNLIPVYLLCVSINPWSAVKPIIQERIAGYASSEIRFNLMGVIKSRLSVYQEQLSQAQDEETIQELQQLIEIETKKRDRWITENKVFRTAVDPRLTL